jgi:hypothetical protein
VLPPDKPEPAAAAAPNRLAPEAVPEAKEKSGFAAADPLSAPGAGALDMPKPILGAVAAARGAALVGVPASSCSSSSSSSSSCRHI